MKTLLLKMLSLGIVWLAVGCTCAAPPATIGMDKKLITAKVSVKTNQILAFMDATTDLISRTRTEPGCLGYNMYQDTADPSIFFFFEEWKDQASIEAHFNAPHFKAFGDKIQSLVTAPPEIVIYNASVFQPQATSN